jgi:hypothetical protein
MSHVLPEDLDGMISLIAERSSRSMADANLEISTIRLIPINYISRRLRIPGKEAEDLLGELLYKPWLIELRGLDRKEMNRVLLSQYRAAGKLLASMSKPGRRGRRAEWVRYLNIARLCGQEVWVVYSRIKRYGGLERMILENGWSCSNPWETSIEFNYHDIRVGVRIPPEVDREAAACLGLMWTRGYLSRKTEVRVRLAEVDGKEDKERILEIFEESFNTKPKLVRWGTSYIFRMYSKAVHDFFLSNGLVAKSNLRDMPRGIERWSEAEKDEFLRWALSYGGHLKSDRFYIQDSSELFLVKLNSLCHSIVGRRGEFKEGKRFHYLEWRGDSIKDVFEKGFVFHSHLKELFANLKV